MRPVHFLLALLFVFSASAEPDAKQAAADDLFMRYQAAVSRQQDAYRDTSVEVTMEGKIPKLRKAGTMSALKRVSALGRVTWKMINFLGDDTVKKEVMARYMAAESDASAGKLDNNIGISTDNYKYKYKGIEYRETQRVHVFELKPKQKRVGLFKGELWLDPDTLLPVRETGRLVKTPSIFIKKMEFTRDYIIKDGIAYLRRMASKTDTRIVGLAELNIEYRDVRRGDPATEETTAQRLGKSDFE